VHEYSIAVELVAEAVRQAQQYDARRIERIVCHCGAMRGVVPELLQDAFSLASDGTAAAGAELVVKTIAPMIHCRACGASMEHPPGATACPACNSTDIAIEGGDELLLASLALEVDDGS
jgi:hydrogenase nickel incorporation protein HypA/HybF